VTVVSTTRTTAYRTLLLSLALFTITPLRQRWIPPADRAHARVALEWLPLIGLLLGAVVGGVAIGLRHAGPLVAATAYTSMGSPTSPTASAPDATRPRRAQS
jgi:cobalamin synthase